MPICPIRRFIPPASPPRFPHTTTAPIAPAPHPLRPLFHQKRRLLFHDAPTTARIEVDTMKMLCTLGPTGQDRTLHSSRNLPNTGLHQPSSWINENCGSVMLLSEIGRYASVAVNCHSRLKHHQPPLRPFSMVRIALYGAAGGVKQTPNELLSFV